MTFFNLNIFNKPKTLNTRNFLKCKTEQKLQQWDNDIFQSFVERSFRENNLEHINHMLKFFPNHPDFIHQWTMHPLTLSLKEKEWGILFDKVKHLPDYILNEWFSSTQHYHEELKKKIASILCTSQDDLLTSQRIAQIPDDYMYHLIEEDFIKNQYKTSPFLKKIAERQTLSNVWVQHYNAILHKHDCLDISFHTYLPSSTFFGFRFGQQPHALSTDELEFFKEEVHRIICSLYIELFDRRGANAYAEYVKWFGHQTIEMPSVESPFLAVHDDLSNMLSMSPRSFDINDDNTFYCYCAGNSITDKKYLRHLILQFNAFDIMYYIQPIEQPHIYEHMLNIVPELRDIPLDFLMASGHMTIKNLLESSRENVQEMDDLLF